MARVFISYRRADGQYAVGWIEERLGRLDEVTSVRTAFRDNTTLRLGDDLPDVLAAEVESCDVLIAVIGPHWRGDRPDGTARILDPNDWIAREIQLAMTFGKRIVPVLIGGIEPLAADTLPPELQPVTELLALRFHDVEDLDRLDEEVRTYLDGIDRERARLRDLDRPIDVPSARQPWVVWAVATIAGLVGGTLAARTVDDTSGDDLEALAVAFGIEVGTWIFFAVWGVSYFHRELAAIIEVRWRTVVRSGALALALIVLTVLAFAPSGEDREMVNIIEATLAVLLLSPWIVLMLGASWSAAASEALRDRARVLAAHRHHQTLATPVLVLALSLAVVTTAVRVFSEEPDVGEPLLLIPFGVFLSLIVLGALVHSSRELAHQSELVRLEVADLAPVYRRHVDEVLADRPIDGRSPLVWMAAAPTVVAAVCAVVVAIW